MTSLIGRRFASSVVNRISTHHHHHPKPFLNPNHANSPNNYSILTPTHQYPFLLRSLSSQPNHEFNYGEPPTEHHPYDKIAATTNHRRRHQPVINVDFGLQVAKTLLEDSLSTTTTTTKNNKNMICSPLSITAVLNILAAGATGDMLKQLLKVLGCADVEEVNNAASRLAEIFRGSRDENAPIMRFASALWLDHRLKLKDSFRQVLRDVHNAEATPVDFQNNQVDRVIEEENLWVEKQTKGLINQILSKDDISKDISMILANTLYFKGVWIEKFKPKNTKDEYFYLLNGEKVQASFMTKSYHEFEYGTFGHSKVLKMLYKEGEDIKGSEKPRRFSMYIFLPDEKDGLPKLLETIKMDGKMFKERIKLEYREIRNLSIPKFSFEKSLPLIKVMKKLGLTLPFEKTCEELSEMVEYPNGVDWPYVSDLFQKCRIEVNEKGTEAAAVTSFECCMFASPPPPSPPPVDFVADHPFMFMIREDISGAILFIGTVLNPLKA